MPLLRPVALLQACLYHQDLVHEALATVAPATALRINETVTFQACHPTAITTVINTVKTPILRIRVPTMETILWLASVTLALLAPHLSTPMEQAGLLSLALLSHNVAYLLLGGLSSFNFFLSSFVLPLPFFFPLRGKATPRYTQGHLFWDTTINLKLASRFGTEKGATSFL